MASDTASLRERKTHTTHTDSHPKVSVSDSITNGKSTALLKINAVPTEHGQEMDKQLDEHQTCVTLVLGGGES
jgi:hypothetical protein